jgi:CheY-like chemotaxis protein
MSKSMETLRILVVEDDAMIGEMLAEMLEGMGHEVCAIEATEADAVTAAARCMPGLMIVDARLGAGSGVAAVAEILRSEFVPHVFISGAAIESCGPAAVVLQKPFREGDLARAIHRALAAAPVT